MNVLDDTFVLACVLLGVEFVIGIVLYVSLRRIRALADVTTAYAVVIEGDLRKTRHAVKELIAALRLGQQSGSVSFDVTGLTDAVAILTGPSVDSDA